MFRKHWEKIGQMKVRLHLNTSAGAAPDRKLPAVRLLSAALSLSAAPCVLAVMTDLWLFQLPARTQTSTEQLQLSSDSTGLVHRRWEESSRTGGGGTFFGGRLPADKTSNGAQGARVSPSQHR